MPHIRDIFLGQGVPEPYRSNRTNIIDNNMFGRTTPEPLSASTKKLFQAIDDENLEAFKQALADGADVNAFDEEGMTPLMSIANAYIASNNQPTLEKMAKLLIQNSNIDINAQSEQPVCEERQKRDQLGRLIYLFRNREIVEVQQGRYRYCDNDQSVDNDELLHLGFSYESAKEEVRTSTRKDTALHIACQVGVKDMVKILLTHPDVGTDVKNCNRESPENCISRGFEDTIKLEFKKAQKGKQLLDALAGESIDQAKVLLNQELNPNCWRRNQNGEIETPLSLTIKSCLQTITRDEEEVLTKLLKHEELDFSQIKPIQNKELELLVELTIKERLTDTIKREDLNDVKKLVEDNCLMSYAIIAAALRGIDDLTEHIEKYLNEKFPVSVGQYLSEGFKQAFQDIAIELESVQAQLAEKEKDLKQAEREKVDQQAKITRLTNENAQLRAQNQDLKNKKSSGIGALGGRHNNYALTFFILSGAFVVGTCLTIVDYPEISAGLAAVALGLFLVGYFLYKGDEKDIGPGSATDNPQVTGFYPLSRFC